MNEFGSRAADAKNLAFAGEMADAARAILRHPGLRGRDRAVWREHCNGATYAEIARTVRCSYRDVSAAIDRAQALMLRPNWEQATMRKPKKRRQGVLDPPPETIELAPFQDIEATIEVGVHNAHRKIVEISQRTLLSSDDVADNERAVHTLLAVRKSELEYLRGRVPPKDPAPDDKVRAAIDQALAPAP